MTVQPKPYGNQGHASPDKGGRDQYKRRIDGLRHSGVTGLLESSQPTPNTTASM
jgi:hypothetical protein